MRDLSPPQSRPTRRRANSLSFTLGDISPHASHPWTPKNVAEVEGPGLLLALSPTLWRMSYHEVWGGGCFLPSASASIMATKQRERAWKRPVTDVRAGSDPGLGPVPPEVGLGWREGRLLEARALARSTAAYQGQGHNLLQP